MKLLYKLINLAIVILFSVSSFAAENDFKKLKLLFSFVDDSDFIGFNVENRLILIRNQSKKIQFLDLNQGSSYCSLPGNFINSIYIFNSNRDAVIASNKFLLVAKHNECVIDQMNVKSFYQNKPNTAESRLTKFISDFHVATNQYIELTMRDAGPPPIYNTLVSSVGNNFQILNVPGATGFGTKLIQKENGFSYNEEARPRFSKDGKYFSISGSFDCDIARSTVYKIHLNKKGAEIRAPTLVPDQNCKDLFTPVLIHDMEDTESKRKKVLTISSGNSLVKVLIENIVNPKVVDVSLDGKIVAVQGFEKSSSQSKKIYVFRVE